MQTPAVPPSTNTDDAKPLASYVLRVRGRRASLRYELHDLRTGERHVFSRTSSVTKFLQQTGLQSDDAEAADEVPG